MYIELEGDLIKMAKDGYFDAIVHGCNCFCTMGAGIAPQMAEAFGCDSFQMEHENYKGDINKLGQIDYDWMTKTPKEVVLKKPLTVVNAYTQYMYGRNHPDGVSQPLDYEALTLCLRKINHVFKGKHIGLPQIGCGLAGGDWEKVKKIIQTELKDCKVTVVIYNKK